MSTQRSLGSNDPTVRFIGGPIRSPGVPNMMTAQPPRPGTTSLSSNPTTSDETLVSEETIVSTYELVPHEFDASQGYRAHELLQIGDVLFTTRVEPSDNRISVFDLGHLNIICQLQYGRYLKLLDSTLEIIAKTPNRTGKITAEMKARMMQWGHLRLREIVEACGSYEPNFYGPGYSSLPKQLPMFLNVARGDQVSTSDKKRFQLYVKANPLELTTPSNIAPPDMAGPSQTLMDGLDKLHQFTNEVNTPQDTTTYNTMKNKLEDREIMQNLVAAIMESNPDIVNFLSVEGIKSQFNYLGIMTSSGDDGTPYSVALNPNSRKIVVGVRGPVEVTNYWGSNLAAGTELSLILKRSYNSATQEWGSFGIFPYWSIEDSTEGIFSKTLSIGPVRGRVTRSKHVPLREKLFIGLSGHEEIGYVFKIGMNRYTVSDTQYGTHRGTGPLSGIHMARAQALGIGDIGEDGNPILGGLGPTVRNATAVKDRIPKINIFSGL